MIPLILKKASGVKIKKDKEGKGRGRKSRGEGTDAMFLLQDFSFYFHLKN